MQDILFDVPHVPIDYDDPVDVKEVTINTSRKDERRERRGGSERRAALEKDVAQLQKKLSIEMKMRNALNRGLSRPLGSLPRIYASLPAETRELLLEVAVLEEEIISLEKQVVHLGKEIENEAPATDKETVYRIPHKMRKVDVSGSPLLSPKGSAKINSKPLASPRKSPDQKCSLSKPSLSSGKIAENNSSPSRVPISPRDSLDNGRSIKSPKPTRVFTVEAPQKSQIQKNSLLPKVRNPIDLKSRRLSFTKKEPGSAMDTVPFIPKNLGLSKEGTKSAPHVSPASGGPCVVKKSLPREPPRMNSQNGKSPMTGHGQLRSKDPINVSKSAPVARTLKKPSVCKPPGEDNGPAVDQARRTPRLPRQPLKQGTISTRRIVGTSAASREQRMDTHKISAPKARTTSDPNCEPNLQSDHQKPIDAEAGEHNSNKDEDIHLAEMLDVDQNSPCKGPSSDHAKASRPPSSPEGDAKGSLEKVTDSVLLSEEVVKLLETIYENLQEKDPPAYNTGSSSQSSMSASTSSTGPDDSDVKSSQLSMSASISSTSPDDYDAKGGANIKYFRLDGCHTESFRTKTSVSMKFMRDCYPREIANTMDPYSYLSRGNMSNRIDYHETLMS